MMIYGLREGQMVRLKSGGPRMTVDKLRPQGRVTCQWFHGDELRRENFHMNTLDLVPINESEEQSWAASHAAALEYIEENKDGGSDPEDL